MPAVWQLVSKAWQIVIMIFQNVLISSFRMTSVLVLGREAGILRSVQKALPE